MREVEAALLYAHLREPPPALPQGPAAADPVLARGLAKDPGERYGSCAELVAALERALAGDPLAPATVAPPAPKAPEPAAPRLPAPPTPLVGRVRELAELEQLVTSRRLVTVTGPGGVGKTRLALAACERLHEGFEDGVRFLQLASLADPALLFATIALALELEERPSEDLIDTLANALQEKELLLCLDNLEQLLEATAFLGELLSRCRRLSLLVTSRSPLRLAAEHEYPLPPLREQEALLLFEERARSVSPGFSLKAHEETVRSICERLDRLPLALELAAARVRLLSPQGLLARLERALPLLGGGPRDLPERQQTLRAAIDWSYQLLDPAEQHLFRALSVFRGGFTLEAAAAIADQDELAVLDPLSALIEHNLVRRRDDQDQEEPRFLLLETIREYAAEQIEHSGEAHAARRRHAQYYLDFAEPGALHVQSPEVIAWLPAAERERANLRAALAWLVEHGTIDQGLRLGARLSPLWYHRGPVREGAESLKPILARPGGDPNLRAHALRAAGRLSLVHGRYGDARAAFSESLRLWRQLDAREEVARDLTNLGVIAHDVGDLPQAIAAHQEAVALARELDEKRTLSGALSNLGLVVKATGDYALARAYYEESLDVDRELEYAYGVAISTLNLGSLMLEQGDHERAEGHLITALEACRSLGADEGTIASLESFAVLAVERGDAGRAALLLAACERQRELLGVVVPGHDRARLDEAATLIRARLDPAELVAARERGQALSLEEAVALAREGARSDAADERKPSR